MTTIHLATAVQNAAANAIVDLIDVGSTNSAGEIWIYDGTIPANANTAISTQQKVCTLTFSSTAFGAASSGVVTAAAITDGTASVSGGGSATATWARIVDKDEATIMDVDVGETAATLILNTTTIVDGATITVSAGTFTMPSGV